MQEFLLASSNEHKALELSEILGIQVELLSLDLIEPQSIQVAEVIEAKARDAFLQTGKAIFVEDTGLYVNAWNGLPGALITWFVKTVGPSGICRMLEEWEDRSARVETILGCFDGESFTSYSGTLDGAISFAPIGTNGFGWDSVFIPKGYEHTLAELSSEEKNRVSARRLAVDQLRLAMLAT